MTVRNPDDETQVADSVLLEAHRLIHGDRNRDYGPFYEDYARTVAIFNAWRGHQLTPADGVAFAVCIKLSRMAESPHKRDHYTDACGYIDGLWQTEEHYASEPD